MLVDTSYVAYRAFFALPNLAANQASTHMVYGFFNSLLSTLRKFPVEDLIIVWDRGYDNKSELYPGYKQKDDIMTPQQRNDFREQFKLLDLFLSWLGVKGCFQQGFEADDIIAYFCRNPCVRTTKGELYYLKKPILIFSGDHDLHPLLSENVAMWKSHKETLYTVDVFHKEYPGLEPWQYQEMQALMGCSGDKVPGVRGIGPKRAANLIRKYGSVSEISTLQDEDRYVKLVQDNWDTVELSKKLVAFEPVTPTITVAQPKLSKLRKHLFALRIDGLIDSWNDLVALTKL